MIIISHYSFSKQIFWLVRNSTGVTDNIKNGCIVSWFQGPGILCAGSVSWLTTGTLDRTEPSLTKFVSPALSLIRRAKNVCHEKALKGDSSTCCKVKHSRGRAYCFEAHFIIYICIFWLQRVLSSNVMGLLRIRSYPMPLCTTGENCSAEAAAVLLCEDIHVIRYRLN